VSITAVDLNIVRWGVFALLFFSVLISEVGVDLHHLQCLMAQMPLERKEFAAFEQESNGVPVAAGMR
jgi:hypothetical protein